MGHISIVFSQWNSTSIGQDNILKWISWNFSAEIEVKSIEKQMFILLVLIHKLLINFISFIIIIIFRGNFFETVWLIWRSVNLNWWILESDSWVKFVVDEFHKDSVKIEECGHYSVVNINWQINWILVWNEISYFLVHDFHLVVDTFYANEWLFKCVSLDDIKLEMLKQFCTGFEFRLWKPELFVGWENSEKCHQWQGIIEVSERIQEVWISFSDQMIKSDLGLVCGQISDLTNVSSGFGSLVLSQVNFLLTQFFDQGVKGQEVDILQMIISSVHLLQFFWWFSWIDAFQYT